LTRNPAIAMSEPTSKYRDLTQSVSAGLSTLRTSTPEVMKSFNDLGQSATASGVLDAKTKELIALALSIASRCDGCVAYHARRVSELGVERAEVVETIGVAIQMGGGPSMVYGGEALRAFDSFTTATLAA
jgi:AhpD family alkylhydroperoxidase